LNIGDGLASDAFTILKNGQTGIGIDNFEVNHNGTGSLLQIGDGSTNVIGYVDNGTGNWVAVSDERKKENITDLSYGLDTLMSLSPKSYTMKSTGEQSIGFIAQQAKDIVPEAVFGSEEKGYGMSYSTIVPVVVKAVQEVVSIGTVFRDNMIAWMGDASNGIERLFVREVHTETLCVGSICLTEDQVRQILQSTGQGVAQSAPSASDNTTPVDPGPTDDAVTTDSDTAASSPVDSTPATDTAASDTSAPSTADTPSDSAPESSPATTE
jgi:hypothetical protein